MFPSDLAGPTVQAEGLPGQVSHHPCDIADQENASLLLDCSSAVLPNDPIRLVQVAVAALVKDVLEVRSRPFAHRF